MVHHPPHVLDSRGRISTSAFIPFCDFGGKMLGRTVPQFSLPVCTQEHQHRRNKNFSMYEVSDLEQRVPANNKASNWQIVAHL